MKQIATTFPLLLYDKPSGKDPIAKESCSASPANLEAARFSKLYVERLHELAPSMIKDFDM
jgi:hypothetical protein